MKLIKSFKIFEDKSGVSDPKLSIREVVDDLVLNMFDSFIELFDKYEIVDGNLLSDQMIRDNESRYWRFMYFNDKVNRRGIEICDIVYPLWDQRDDLFGDIQKVRFSIARRIGNPIAARIVYDSGVYHRDGNAIEITIPDLSVENKKKVIGR